MRIKLIACEVFAREMGAAAAGSKHVVDITFLPFGLHRSPDDLRARLQSEIDTAGDGCDYIALGYGLCSRGTAGLAARSIPLVIARAHDCITLLLGSRDRYDAEFSSHPGTYYYSSGWIERSEGDVEQGTVSPSKGRYEQYAAKYGEDNASFLIEQEDLWLSNYTRGAFINTHIGPVEAYRDFTMRIAASHGWSCEEIEGDLSLVSRLLNGQWDGDDFLIVRAGRHIVESFDDRIIEAAPTAM